MAIGDLPSNKLISLTLQGYNPYQPDCGIYCGGYQGIMYPNPTTLIAPSILFNPYEHTDPVASEYPMGPPYHGLGKGNPGISYINPGHILGLFDTYGRMNYGMSFLKAAHAGIDISSNPTPFISEMSLPLLSGEIEREPLTIDSIPTGLPPPQLKLRLIDIYPELTEEPGDWYNHLSVDPTDGSVDPDIRPWVPFTVSSPYEPGVANIDAEKWNALFPGSNFQNNRRISDSSYPGIINRLRAYWSQLYTVAEPLANLFTTSFTLNNANQLDSFIHEENVWMPDYEALNNRFWVVSPTSQFEPYSYYEPESMPNIWPVSPHSDILSVAYATIIPERNDLTINDEGTYFHKCTVLTPLQANKVLTGNDKFHNGVNENQFEYRSLTELNSVINTVPIQSVAASYKTNILIPPYNVTLQEFVRDSTEVHNIWIYSYTITDVVINISEARKELGTVTIAGNVNMKVPIIDPSPFYTTADRRLINWDHTWDPGSEIYNYLAKQKSHRRVNLQAMLTNKHSFDRAWLDTHEDDQDYAINEEHNILITYGNIDTSDFIVPFSKTFQPQAGCNTLKMRLIARNNFYIAPSFSLNNWAPENMWTPYINPGYGYYYRAGLLSCGYINDPTTMWNSIISPSITTSLTITGENMDPVIHEISV